MRSGFDSGTHISNDQSYHEKYRNDVFLPFVDGTRESYLRERKWSRYDTVPDDSIFVSWQVCVTGGAFIFFGTRGPRHIFVCVWARGAQEHL